MPATTTHNEFTMKNNSQILKLSDAEYFSRLEMSKHSLDDFAKNPHAFFAKKSAGITDDSDTPALALGRAVHASVLERPVYEAEYVSMPDTIKVRRGKEWESFKESNKDKQIISRDDLEIVEGVTVSVSEHRNAKQILDMCKHREFAVIWEEPTSDNGVVPMRAKIDFGNANYSIIGDLKTTQDASPEAFSKDSDAFGYDIQAAVYISAMQACGHKPKLFVFIVVEKTFPYTVSTYTFDVDSDFVQAGLLEYRKRLKSYSEYINGTVAVPSGWSEHNIQLPPWSKRAKALVDSLSIQ